jgi:AcrR family transcriptional regulator
MPKIVDRARKRAEILEGSFTLFARQGYQAVSMRQIAEALNVSTGTLYHYFSNKEELFRHIVEHVSDRDVLQATEEIQQAEGFNDKWQQLIQFIEQNERHFRDLLFLAFDYVRAHPEKKPVIITAIIERYVVAIERELNLTGSGLGPILCSSLVGLVCQRMMAEDLTSFDEVRRVTTQLAKMVDDNPSMLQQLPLTPNQL